MATCAGFTQKGDRCQNKSIQFVDSFGYRYCYRHSPLGSTNLKPKFEDQDYVFQADLNEKDDSMFDAGDSVEEKNYVVTYNTVDALEDVDSDAEYESAKKRARHAGVDEELAISLRKISTILNNQTEKVKLKPLPTTAQEYPYFF